MSTSATLTAPAAPRLLPTAELPAYTYVPGSGVPHPIRDPRGHSYNRKNRSVRALVPEALVLTALLGATLKDAGGQLTLQAQTESAPRPAEPPSPQMAKGTLAKISPRKRPDVDALVAQRLHLGDGRTAHALHDHHALRAQVPVDLWHQQQRRAFEVAPQLAGAGCLAHQVELLLQVAGELGDHLARTQPPAVGPQPLDLGRGVREPVT